MPPENKSYELPSPKVQQEVDKANPWYIGSQFEWVNKPKIRRIYDRRRTFMRQCLDMAKQGKAGPVQVLDLGCGDGYWLYELSKDPSLELVGIDYNPVRIERTRGLLPDIKVIEGDITQLEPTDQYDVILLNHVIEHVENDVGLLKTIRAFLKPNGLLILGTPNEGSKLQQRWLNRQDDPFITDHVHFYTESEIRAKLESAGFQVDRTLREAFFLFNDKWYYSMTKRDLGFHFLELLTRLFPGECSGYYFACRPS